MLFRSMSTVSLLLLVGGAGAAPFAQSEEGTGSVLEFKLPQIQGLEDPNTFVPAENPMTAKKIELGRLLFFDKRLSKNDTIACASCHLPAKGFTDGMPVQPVLTSLRAAAVRRRPSIACSARRNSGMAGPIRWKTNPSARS